jgi:hypothetical protein
MSSHYASSHYASSHYLSSHYGRILSAVILLDLPGGSSDPARIAQQIAPKVTDPVLRAKLLREDEEILAIIMAAIKVIDP